MAGFYKSSEFQDSGKRYQENVKQRIHEDRSDTDWGQWSLNNSDFAVVNEDSYLLKMDENKERDIGLMDEYETQGASDGSEESESEEEMVEVSDGTSTLYFHSKEGMAQCEYCGSFGVKDAFYSKTKQFCSVACSRNFATACKDGTPIPKQMGATPIKIKTFTKPKQTKPKQTKSGGVKAFDWEQFLKANNPSCASVKCFQHVPLAESWDVINSGLKLEVVNTEAHLPTTVYWIASIIKLAGYKAMLRYEGYGAYSGSDFWVNLMTHEIHPVGWCAANHKPLVPPREIQDKYVDWKEYLVKRLTGSCTLPHNFHSSVSAQLKDCPLRKGMSVEVVDKMCLSSTRVATVLQVVGSRVKLRYQNCPQYENDTFWCDCCSPLVHPVGWSQLVGHKIIASPEYCAQSLAKIAVNQYDKNDAAPHMFPAILDMPHTNGVKFQTGMKLEAIDPLNLSAICVATVMKVLKNNYLMIGIDGSSASDGSDWFCYHATSPCIFPVGFCEVNNLILTPPRQFRGEFRWLDYLKQTRSVAAPVKLFSREMVNHGFRVGMKIEAADLMDPKLICVASVAKVLGRLLRIHFDGWDTSYDQWVDCQSPDIYPVGWCQMVGIILEGPKDTASETQINTAAKITKKRKSKTQPQKGAKKKRKGKASVGAPRASSKQRLNSQGSMEHSDLSNDGVHDGGTHTKQMEVHMYAEEGSSVATGDAASPGSFSPIADPSSPSTSPRAHVTLHHIPRLLPADSAGNSATSTGHQPITPHLWGVFEVCQFLRINDCQQYCDIFKSKKMNGLGLLSASKEQLAQLTGMKVAPSLRIHQLVQTLKSTCDISSVKALSIHQAGAAHTAPASRS